MIPGLSLADGQKTTVQKGDEVLFRYEFKHSYLSINRGCSRLKFCLRLDHGGDDKLLLGLGDRREQARMIIEVLMAFTGLEFVKLAESEVQKRWNVADGILIWRVA